MIINIIEYGSYNLNYVFNWLGECFNIVNNTKYTLFKNIKNYKKEK